MSTDLATTVARDLIDPIADEIVRDPAIRLRVARRLRDDCRDRAQGDERTPLRGG
jgi:hypothetical protein